jgi:hypothetical protein
MSAVEMTFILCTLVRLAAAFATGFMLPYGMAGKGWLPFFMFLGIWVAARALTPEIGEIE